MICMIVSIESFLGHRYPYALHLLYFHLGGGGGVKQSWFTLFCHGYIISCDVYIYICPYSLGLPRC